jgi:DHA1 family bicyclomycin/chloramphenicol resistance-like MFS transporter
MDAYVPALPSVARDFGLVPSSIQLTVTTFLLGVAFGQLLVGPVSDVLGRRRPLALSLVLYVGAGAICAIAQSLPLLAAARFVQGATASASVVISRAIVRDISAEDEIAHRYSKLFLAVAVSASISPLIGTCVLFVASWQAIFALLAVLGMILLVISMTCLPETASASESARGVVASTVASFAVLARHRAYIWYALALAAGTGALVSMTAGAPFAVENVYGFPPRVFGFLFALGSVATVGLTLLNGRLLSTLASTRLLVVGFAINCIAGCALLLLGRFQIWVFVPAFIGVFGAWGFVGPNAMALAVRSHQQIAGAALALVGFTQFGVAALAAPVSGIGANSGTTALAAVVTFFAAAGSLFAFLGIRESRILRTDIVVG